MKKTSLRRSASPRGPLFLFCGASRFSSARVAVSACLGLVYTFGLVVLWLVPSRTPRARAASVARPRGEPSGNDPRGVGCVRSTAGSLSREREAIECVPSVPCSEINAAIVYAALKRRSLCPARRAPCILRAPKHAGGKSRKRGNPPAGAGAFSEVSSEYFRSIFKRFLNINEKICFDYFLYFFHKSPVGGHARLNPMGPRAL